MDEPKKVKKAPGTRKFWYLAIGGGLLAHLLGLALMRIEPLPEKPLLLDRPYMTLADGGRAGNQGAGFDRVALLDTSPLFLPSRWNSSVGRLERIRGRKPGDLFASYPPELSFVDSAAAAELSLRLQNSADSLELLLDRDQFPFASFGKYDREKEEVTGRFARVEVVRFDGGRSVRRWDLSAEEVSGVFEEAAYPADPMAFSVHVSGVGFLGPIFLLESSGSEKVDRYFRETLRESLREVFRDEGGLSSGYYRVVIGP